MCYLFVIPLLWQEELHFKYLNQIDGIVGFYKLNLLSRLAVGEHEVEQPHHVSRIHDSNRRKLNWHELEG